MSDDIKLPEFTPSHITGNGEYGINNKPYVQTSSLRSSVAAQLNPAMLNRNAPITYRGEWQPDTRYYAGDYVYLSKRRPGYFFRCVVGGISQSDMYGYSDFTEPAWILKDLYDGRLVWTPVLLKDIDQKATNLRDWTPNTLYYIGNTVRQANGKPIIFEDGNELVYQLTKVITKIDWPRTPDERVTEGSVEWETQLSCGYLLPKARLAEPTFYEFVQIMDYLVLHEQIIFDDYIHKYNDLTKVRNLSLKEIIAESGYNYVSNILNLEDKELMTLVKYIAIISDLKGNKSGLEVVFNLLSMRYSMQEWWEKNPQGTPDTWDLSIEVEIDKVSSDMISKVVAFTRNYVYPIIENFEITYKMDMAEMAIVMAGFVDTTINTSFERGGLIASIGGFQDDEYECEASTPIVNYIITGGFIDLGYDGKIKSTKTPLLVRAFGTMEKSLDFDAVMDLTAKYF